MPEPSKTKVFAIANAETEMLLQDQEDVIYQLLRGEDSDNATRDRLELDAKQSDYYNANLHIYKTSADWKDKIAQDVHNMSYEKVAANFETPSQLPRTSMKNFHEQPNFGTEVRRNILMPLFRNQFKETNFEPAKVRLCFMDKHTTDENLKNGSSSGHLFFTQAQIGEIWNDLTILDAVTARKDENGKYLDANGDAISDDDQDNESKRVYKFGELEDGSLLAIPVKIKAEDKNFPDHKEQKILFALRISETPRVGVHYVSNVQVGKSTDLGVVPANPA